jgi:serpin B
MTIIQPDSRDTQSFLAEITPENIDNWVNQTVSGSTELHLPKFKFEYKITLNEILSAMGLSVAFGPGADFSEMFSSEMSLVINRILHQSFLEVNEEGTEAAAATVVEVKLTSAPIDPVPPVVRVDSPFIFLIREKHSNTILFAGALQNPAGL